MQKMLGLMPGMGEMSKMMESEDTEGGMKQMVRHHQFDDPPGAPQSEVIDRAAGIASPAGPAWKPQEVNQLVKQFDMMAPIMKTMAGKGMADRMQAIRELQGGGLLDPGRRGPG